MVLPPNSGREKRNLVSLAQPPKYGLSEGQLNPAFSNADQLLCKALIPALPATSLASVVWQTGNGNTVCAVGSRRFPLSFLNMEKFWPLGRVGSGVADRQRRHPSLAG